MSKKYNVCCDFDGVLHAYDSPWTTATEIHDGPVPGAMAWVVEVVGHPELMLHIHSSRSSAPGGIQAMKEWMRRHLEKFMLDAGFEPVDACEAAQREYFKIKWPTEKPPSVLYIDDRGYHFTGAFPSPEWILKFRPWNKRWLPGDGGPPTLPPRPSPETIQEIARTYRTRTAEESLMEGTEDWAIGQLLSEIEHLGAVQALHDRIAELEEALFQTAGVRRIKHEE